MVAARRQLIVSALVASLVAAATARAADAGLASVCGDWLVADRTGVIRVAPCGAQLCGTIVGMTEWPHDDVPRDAHGQSQCHLVIVRMRRAEGAAPRWHGTILDPNDDSTYDATLRPGPEDTLLLRGFLALPIFGRTEHWTRFTGTVPADCHLPPRV